MAEELRLGLDGRELQFPDGRPFCLVCGDTPSGTRRVWFEDTGAASAGLPGHIGSADHALGTGARAIANRIDFHAPLCSRHRRRAVVIGLAALGCMLLAVGVIILDHYLIDYLKGLLKIRRRYDDIVGWMAFLPSLIPAGFGVYFWRKKDRGGLTCDVRREAELLVLTYSERTPQKLPAGP
jgi:hypothetical protein